ncbi:hypothetical protein Tco_1055991 [Tanacetum coccineum]|uniref:Integrase, catalytic region, zinc finger, CCHC-type, peptidase aspartic, catalytic n=1 Tax=Tanacetum coccineum TaxID=301880 RepID=A0ABQ5H254_9ASTR
MSSTSDDIQAVRSDTRPLMLDRTDYESWAQRLPKDIYMLVKHITEAKVIWNDIKMLMGNTRLTKDVCTRPEVQDPGNDIDHVGKKHEVHEIHYEVQQTNVLDSDSADMGNSNIIPYEQYVKHNEGLVIPSGESSVPNDAYVMHENSAYVPDDSLTTKLNIYKEQVAIYEQRAQNPFYLRKTKVAQPALYDGDEILKTHHVPVRVTSSEEDLEIAEIPRQKMNEKFLNDPVVSSQYPVHLVPRTLPTTSQVNIDVVLYGHELECLASRFHDLSTAYNVAMTRVVELESENSKLLDNIQHGSHDTMPLESQNFQLQDTINKLQKENDCFRAENSKIKQHYKELYDSIKITRATHIEKITSLLNEIETLKTQAKGKMPVITNENVIPKVSVCNKYAIDVEPIPPRQRNNRNVQQGYLNRLKDTLDTLREIVEEARSKRTSDNSLEYACVYTKTSQELLENVIALCPKTVNKRDRYNASTHAKRNKHVTFVKPLETSNHSTSKPVQHSEVKNSNVPISPSTEVNSDTKASRSKPRSNIKNDRTSTAKSVPKKKVEDHIRNTNRPTNPQSRKFGESNKLSKLGKQQELFAFACYHGKPMKDNFTLGEQCPLTRITKPKVVPVRQWKPTGRIIPLGEQCPVTRSIASTSALIIVETHAPMVPIVPDNACTNQLEPNINWESGTPNSPFLSVFKCRSYRSSCDLWTQAVHNI